MEGFAQTGPAPAGQTESVAPEDIVTTARKTEERLQDAPTTVAVATAPTTRVNSAIDPAIFSPGVGRGSR